MGIIVSYTHSMSHIIHKKIYNIYNRHSWNGLVISQKRLQDKDCIASEYIFLILQYIWCLLIIIVFDNNKYWFFFNVLLRFLYQFYRFSLENQLKPDFYLKLGLFLSSEIFSGIRSSHNFDICRQVRNLLSLSHTDIYHILLNSFIAEVRPGYVMKLVLILYTFLMENILSVKC